MTRPWRILRALLLCRPAARLPRDEWKYVRHAILVRDDHCCRFRRLWGWGRECRRTAEDVGEPLEVDHILPKAWGGSDDYENLRASCEPHNQDKRDRPPLGWLLRRGARQTALYAAVGYFAVMSWHALPEPPAEASAGHARAYAAVVSPEHAARLQPGDVGTYADRGEAERVAATWAGMGAGGTWYVAEIPVSP